MTDDERAIRRLVEGWAEATRAGDTEAVLQLMTDDVVFMLPGWAPFGKAEFRAAMGRMADYHFEGGQDIRELHVLGDRAYMRSHVDAVIKPKEGAPIARFGDTLAVLRKGADGLWRLACDANLLI